MNLRRIALISLLCCTVGIPLTGQAETKLVFNVFLPPGHFLRAESARWAAEVEKATEGRVKVEIPAGSLAPPPQQLSAVKSGIADMAVMANVFLGRGAPLTQMSTMPFLVSDASAASVALWRVHEKHLAAKNEFKDVQLLSLFHFSPGYLYSMTDAPVNSVDELKARRMWALPGEAADVMKSLGVSPVTAPAVKVNESVSTGVVNAVYGLSADAMVDFKASAYVKALTKFPKGATSTSFSLFINKAKWASLSEQDRKIIQGLTGEAFARRAGLAARKNGDEAIAQMKSAGVRIVDADPKFYQALQGAAKTSYDAFKAAAAQKGLDGGKLVEAFAAEYQSLEGK